MRTTGYVYSRMFSKKIHEGLAMKRHVMTRAMTGEMPMFRMSRNKLTARAAPKPAYKRGKTVSEEKGSLRTAPMNRLKRGG